MIIYTFICFIKNVETYQKGRMITRWYGECKLKNLHSSKRRRKNWVPLKFFHWYMPLLHRTLCVQVHAQLFLNWRIRLVLAMCSLYVFMKRFFSSTFSSICTVSANLCAVHLAGYSRNDDYVWEYNRLYWKMASNLTAFLWSRNNDTFIMNSQYLNLSAKQC